MHTITFKTKTGGRVVTTVDTYEEAKVIVDELIDLKTPGAIISYQADNDHLTIEERDGEWHYMDYPVA